MQEKPIDPSELDQLVQHLRTARNALTGWTAVITALRLVDLAERHEDWLKLYQLGQDISHVAERLDSLYQAQFAVPAPDEENSSAGLGDASQDSPQQVSSQDSLNEKRQQAVDWLEDMFGNISRPSGFTRELTDDQIFAEMARCKLQWIARDASGYWYDRERAFYHEYEAWYRDYEFDLVDNLGPAPQPESYRDWARRESFTNHRYIAPDNDYFWWDEESRNAQVQPRSS